MSAETHDFAEEIRSVFQESGWTVAWSEFIAIASATSKPLVGLELQIPKAVMNTGMDKDIIEALRICDPQLAITDLPEPKTIGDLDSVLHVVIGNNRPLNSGGGSRPTSLLDGPR